MCRHAISNNEQFTEILEYDNIKYDVKLNNAV